MMTAVSVILSSAIFIIINRIYPGLILSNISGDLAEVEGIKTKRYNLLYLLLIAVVVALGIRVTGSLLVGALVIIPAATARNMSRNLRQYSFGSIVFGVLSCIFGILLSGLTGISAGILIILCSGFFFLISLLFKK
jgi:ABC-type Mn2+/Zn2+ transport system permease subunit